MVPWLVAIPASPLSGLLSDHLINQGEPWGRGGGIPPGCHCSKEEASPLRTSHDVGPRFREPALGALVPNSLTANGCLQAASSLACSP